MVGHVALGVGAVVHLLQAALDRELGLPPQGARMGPVADVAPDQVHQVVDVALLEDDQALHVALAEGQLGIARQPHRRPRLEPDPHLGPGAVAIGRLPTVRFLDREISDRDQPLQ